MNFGTKPSAAFYLHELELLYETQDQSHFQTMQKYSKQWVMHHRFEKIVHSFINNLPDYLEHSLYLGALNNNHGNS